jgi:hypothetical protein
MPDLNTEILSPEPTESVVKLSELEQVEGLLSGQGTDGESQAEPQAEMPNDAPKEAERPGIDYEVEIPMADGEKVKLGALKDFYQGQATAKLELIERENQVLKVKEEAEYLLSYIEQLPPEVRARAEQQAVYDYQREMKLLKDAIPEVQTKEGGARVKESIYALAKEYGIDPHRIDQIKDHVTVKVLYDFARLKASIKEAKANVKPLRSPDARPTQASKQTPNELQAKIARAKQTRNSVDEVQAIDALLRSA